MSGPGSPTVRIGRTVGVAFSHSSTTSTVAGLTSWRLCSPKLMATALAK